MVEATSEVRKTCAGNCENTRTQREQLDRARLWEVMLDHSKGTAGGTLEDAIRPTTTKRTRSDLQEMQEAGKKRKYGEMGRIWLRMRDVPDVLFIRIARFQQMKSGRSFRKCNNEVLVPEILNLAPFVEDVSTEGRYRLCEAVNHAGTINSGHFVSHIRDQNRQWYLLDDDIATNSSIATLNDDPSKFGKYKFMPFVVAYTKIFDNDESPDPTLQQPSFPTTPANKDVRFRVKVELAGQTFTMTRKLKGFETFESRDIGMEMDIADGDGNSVLQVEPIIFELIKAQYESETTGPKTSPEASRKPLPKTGLATQSPTPPKKTKTRTPENSLPRRAW
jgi:Ubiquitin carboxyl-terminal hydrolase